MMTINANRFFIHDDGDMIPVPEEYDRIHNIEFDRSHTQTREPLALLSLPPEELSHLLITARNLTDSWF